MNLMILLEEKYHLMAIQRLVGSKVMEISYMDMEKIVQLHNRVCGKMVLTYQIGMMSNGTMWRST